VILTTGRCEACQTVVANTKHQTVLKPTRGASAIPRREASAIPRRETSATPRREASAIASPRQAKRFLPKPVRLLLLLLLCGLTVALAYVVALALLIRLFGVGREIPGGVTSGILTALTIQLALWADPTLFEA